MVSAQLYDAIGKTYTATRTTDPRIAHRIWAALEDARTILNVGAGTGSYEPGDREVLAVEPSKIMRAQRPTTAAPCIAAAAEALPFKDNAFEGAMAVATIHHWRDPIKGLREMKRVAGRVVVFTYDLNALSQFWLTRDYLPELVERLEDRPTLSVLAEAIGARTEAVPIPWDCVDGFYEAYWRRPEAYLDEGVRKGISIWSALGPDVERRAVRGLAEDLASGQWASRNEELVDAEEADLGLRLLIA